MKKFLLFVLLLTGLQASGLKFLHQDVGARYGAMGGIGTVNADDAFALYWNPALIQDADKLQVGLNQTQHFQGTTHSFAGVVIPIKSWNIGLSVNYSNVNEIEIREIPQINPVEETEWEDWYIGLSLLKTINEKLSVGFTYKKIYQNIYDEKAGGYGLDFGVNYKYSSKINFSAAVKNVGQMNDLNQEATELPLSFEFGGYYNNLVKIGEGNLHAGILGQFIKNSPDNQTLIKTGVEYEYSKLFFLRAGYINGNDLLNYSIGLGIRKDVFEFNWAWKNGRDGLNDINMFSFHFLF